MMNKLSLFIILSFFSNIHSIYDLNTLKDEAEYAFLAKEYQLATDKYTAILKQTNSEACQLNMAHAFLLDQDTSNAIQTYQQNFIYQVKQSIASSQLGVITFDKAGITDFKPLSKKQKKPVIEALNYFKNALKQDVTNEKARYNYEILKYLLEQKEPDNQDNKQDQNKDEENQDKENNQENKKNQENKEQNSDNSDQNQDNKDQKENDSQNDQDGKESDQNEQNQKDQEGKEGENSKKDGQKSKNGKPENEKAQEDKNSKEGNDKENPTDEKDQTKEGKEGKDKSDKNGTKNEQQQSQKDANDKIIDERLKAQKMTKQQAQKLLNSTNQQETKYLQQIKRQGNKKQQSKSKNDW